MSDEFAKARKNIEEVTEIGEEYRAIIRIFNKGSPSEGDMFWFPIDGKFFHELNARQKAESERLNILRACEIRGYDYFKIVRVVNEKALYSQYEPL